MDRPTGTDQADISRLWEAGDGERSLSLPWCPRAGHLLSSGNKALLPTHTPEGLTWVKPTGISRQPGIIGMATSKYSLLGPEGPGADAPCPEHKPDGGSRALPSPRSTRGIPLRSRPPPSLPSPLLRLALLDGMPRFGLVPNPHPGGAGAFPDRDPPPPADLPPSTPSIRRSPHWF